MPTTVLFNFSNMNPPCANKSHHPGTTPIGRQGEEEEIKGGSKPTKTSVKYNIITRKRWEQSNRQRTNARAKEKRGSRTPEQVAHTAAVTKAYKVKNRDKLRRQAAAYRRRKEETEGRGAH